MYFARSSVTLGFLFPSSYLPESYVPVAVNRDLTRILGHLREGSKVQPLQRGSTKYNLALVVIKRLNYSRVAGK